MEKPPFPLTISSTALDAFRNCPQKFYLNYVRRLGQPTTSIHLHAGRAFAKGLEMARAYFFQTEGRDPEAAYGSGLLALLEEYGEEIDLPPEAQHKSRTRMVDAYCGYWDRWPLDMDVFEVLSLGDKQAAEFSFAIPLPIDNPSTGEPILITGRLDWIADYQRTVLVVDEKTSGWYEDLRPETWGLRSQLMCYAWAAQIHGIPAKGSVVRLSYLTKAETSYHEFLFLYPPFLLDRWYQQLLRDVRRAVKCWEEDIWDYDFGNSCNAYKGCAFRRLCTVEDRDSWIVPLGFVEKPVKELITLK